MTVREQGELTEISAIDSIYHKTVGKRHISMNFDRGEILLTTLRPLTITPTMWQTLVVVMFMTS